MDLRRLRLGEKLAGGGGIALLVLAFLPWYARSEPQSAWEAFAVIDLLLALTALMGVAVAILAVTRRAPALPVAVSVLLTALAAVVSLLLAYRLLNQPGPNELVDVRPAAYLGLACLLVLAAGGWRSVADENAGGAATPEVPARPAPPVAQPGQAGDPRPS